MVEIKVQYQGDLHCEAVHGPSGTQLTTDAPRDNQGRGESFSPTDLVATALASCVLTTVAIMGRTLGLDITGATAAVEKHMSTEGPRRIAGLPLKINIPQSISDENKLKFERAAHTCPVHRSLHPDVDAPIEFSWG